MTAEPMVTGNDNTLIGAADFEPALAEEFASQHSADPIVTYEANNMLLTASADEYPYNNQFEPQDAADGYGLYYDANGGDQFNAFDVNAPFNFDNYINDQYNLNLNGYTNSF
jgi:hypothetical protein